MKKLLMTMMLMPLMALADTEIVDGIPWTYTVSGGKAEIYNLNSSAIPIETTGAITVPAALGGCPVTKIGSCALKDCSGLVSVTIPAGVTWVLSDAFRGCGNLVSIIVDENNPVYCSLDGVLYDKNKTELKICPEGKSGSVTIPESVTEVYADSFSGCSGLTAIEVDENNQVYCSLNGVLYYKRSFFIEGKLLGDLIRCPVGMTGDLKIPEGVEGIGCDAFSGCSGLTSVLMPDGVMEINSCAFAHCTGLTSVTMPSSVMRIYELAFKDCTGLTSVTISSKYIESEAFWGCTGLKSVTMSEGVTSIGDSVFEGCTGLKEVTIPEGVTSIGQGAFASCTGLTSVTIPESVTWIGNCAFGGCEKLLSVTIRSKAVQFESDVFLRTSFWDNLWKESQEGLVIHDGVVFGIKGNCPSIVELPVGTRIVARSAFENCETLTAITMPEGVTSIGGSAFRGCRSLKTFNLPETVSAIGFCAFDGCDIAGNGVIIVDGCVLGVKGECPTNVVIPDGVHLIADGAFSDCWRNLKTLKLPKSLRNVGVWAFEGVEADVLEIEDLRAWCNVDFAISQDEDFPWYSFAAIKIGGQEVRNLVIPTEVTEIKPRAFFGWIGIDEVTIHPNVTIIGDDAFYGYKIKKAWVYPGDADRVRELCRFGYWDDNEEYHEAEYCELQMANDVIFNANGGMCSVSSLRVNYGMAIGVLPIPTREGYEFLGWFTAEDGGTQVTAETIVMTDMTLYAQWRKEGDEQQPEEPVGPTTPTNAPPTVVDEAETHVDVENGEVAPFETAAAVYDGFLYEGGKIAGSVQVKVAKMKNGSAKVTATVQLAGEAKKLSFKGGVADATGKVTDMTDKDGNKLAVTVGVKGLGGEFRRAGGSTPYRIDGARNVFSGKSAADKEAAGDAARLYQGVYNVAFDGGTLSVSVDKKGKVKIAGTVKGNKVSATSQLVVGKDAAVVPVVITKKVNLSFCLWVMADGTVEARGIEGAIAGKAGTLKAGAKFGVDGAAGVRALPGLYGEYLPNGIDVAASGTKWVVAGGAKAGKVAFVKGGNTVDESKLGANPSGLKLTYKQKDGTFKGSFKVYNLESNGKIKAYTANVTGVMIGTKGYGTATIKKFGSVAVTIE